MSVVGYDVGNANCFIAIAKAGGIETIANEYSDRLTPAMVGFNSKQRFTGASAKNQMSMNFKSTISQFKRFIGHRFDEPQMEKEFAFIPNTCVPMDDGSVGFKVQYKNEERIFSAGQIYTMLLTQLKQTTQEGINAKVTDCVISVPSYFTDFQRRCVLQSATVAGLNCLRVMNDTSAVALNYGLFKQDLPAPDAKPRNVAFVDMGNASFQVCIAQFNKGKIRVLSNSSDANLGGRDFDRRLQQYFAEEFLTKYKIDARKNLRAWFRLAVECEKVKKQMSTNSTTLPLNIECFMEDKDVSHKVNRDQFELLCEDLYTRIEPPLVKAIKDSGLSKEDIEVVELVGGAIRMPAVKAIIEKCFGKPLSTTLNLDEAVARGCAIQCAMLSHTVKVRDIEVIDAATYPIMISWDSFKADEQFGEMEVFKKYHAYPFTKLLTFPHRVQPFNFNAFYGNDVVLPNFERKIAAFTVNAAAPTESTDMTKVKVKVKVRLDIHGCFTVYDAHMVETLPPAPEVEKEQPMEESQPPPVNGTPEKQETNPAKDKMETEDPKENITENEPAATETKAKKGTPKKEDKKDVKKEEVKKPEAKIPKKLTKSTDLSVDKHLVGLSAANLNHLIEIENELISQVRLEKDRSDARNRLEEYIYGMRDKIHAEYLDNIAEADRTAFSEALTVMEDWLYEDDEERVKQIYVDKLSELQKIGTPVIERHFAHANIPAAFESLGTAITHYRKILEKYANKDEEYNHIDEAEMKKVHAKVEEKFSWFNEKMQAMGKCPKHVSPPVLPAQIQTEIKVLKDFCNPIVNKSKPKVEPPKDTKVDENKTSTDAPKEGENMETEGDKSDAPSADAPSATEKEGVDPNLDMEVD